MFEIEGKVNTAIKSREKMAEIILERTGMTGGEAFHTIHNYIDTKEMILRKGAIAAHKGEKVLIPINMRDGSVLAIGKGNPEWNYSAPHGAGRVMSRSKAKNTLSMEEYKEEMKGIYTTSVNEKTLDEAPMAYKSLNDIIDVIKESVEVIDVMKPIYNFKASD
jgi:RNA-splicing ligase RtcB